MDFKTYWQRMTVPQRDAFAKNVGTSPGYCHQIAYGDKSLELGLADAIVAQAGADLTLDDLPLTERARFQRAARDGIKVAGIGGRDAAPVLADDKSEA
jgi:hypothetical protein